MPIKSVVRKTWRGLTVFQRIGPLDHRMRRFFYGKDDNAPMGEGSKYSTVIRMMKGKQ